MDLSIIFLWALVQIQMIKRGNDGDMNFELQKASLDKSSSITGTPLRKKGRNDDSPMNPNKSKIKAYDGEFKGGDYDPLQEGGLLDESL